MAKVWGSETGPEFNSRNSDTKTGSDWLVRLRFVGLLRIMVYWGSGSVNRK